MRSGKLVRDLIPERIRASGSEPTVVILDDDATFVHALIDKLHEEAEEFRLAKDSSHALEELADLLEVIRALARTIGATLGVVEDVADGKKQRVGEFSKRVYLCDPSKPAGERLGEPY